MNKGDLVLTPDGYYGIVMSPTSVFLSNGAEEVLTESEMAECKRLPINIYDGEGSAAANFNEVVEGRAPSQGVPQ